MFGVMTESEVFRQPINVKLIIVPPNSGSVCYVKLSSRQRRGSQYQGNEPSMMKGNFRIRPRYLFQCKDITH